MLRPAVRYLTIRSLGAPAVLLSLAMQGVFRGFKDTKTPLYATGKNIYWSCPYFGWISTLITVRKNIWSLMCLTLLTFLVSFSGWRCSKHHTRPNFDVCLSHGCHWRSSCPCHFSVSFSVLPPVSASSTAPAFHFIDQFLLTFLTSRYCRYLITMILLCRLIRQVDVIPPSLKSLKFGRFLGCGEIPLGYWNWITSP